MHVIKRNHYVERKVIGIGSARERTDKPKRIMVAQFESMSKIEGNVMGGSVD